MGFEVTEQVRTIAALRGVSERTVWRWFARMREEGTTDLLLGEPLCEWCDDPLPEDATIRRRFCDGACRLNNHRHPGDSERQRLQH
jgi:hypothetical protein